jgi:hypothetical protein
MPTLTITWHAMSDARTCPICLALDGYRWTFQTGVDAFPNFLEHPSFGVVWDTARGSMAHGHIGENCRCYVSTEFDLKDILEKVKRLYDDVKQMYGTESHESI